jgi:hypothetical protein
VILPGSAHSAEILQLTERHVEGALVTLDTGLFKPATQFLLRFEFLVVEIRQPKGHHTLGLLLLLRTGDAAAPSGCSNDDAHRFLFARPRQAWQALSGLTAGDLS